MKKRPGSVIPPLTKKDGRKGGREKSVLLLEIENNRKGLKWGVPAS